MNVREGLGAHVPSEQRSDTANGNLNAGLMHYDNYLFDLDGTIYTGSKALDGAADVIAGLRMRGKSVLFATNTTVYTREEVRDKLGRMNIGCGTDEIVTALTVAGMYFQAYAPDASVYPIGGEAMLKELAGSGIRTVEDASRASHVLVGLDPQFNYEKLTNGMNAVRSGARLIAANPDPFCPTETGAIPDTWSLVKAIETASMLETFATVGKPSTYYAEHALRKLDSSPHQCLMIGDRLETDILLGARCGMHTALVLSGADSLESMEGAGIRPDYVWPSVAALLEAMEEAF